MSQSEMYSAFEKRLLPGERIISVLENLTVNLEFVPGLHPSGDYDAESRGALALTNRRMVAVWRWKDEQVWRWLHILAVDSFWEIATLLDPYQVVVMIPGGLQLLVQTGARQGPQLSSLLSQAIVHLGTSRDDMGATAAIIAHEEEERRRRD